MVWCPSCVKNCKRPVFVNGFLCCSMCGRVINEDNFSDEPTFVKNAGGQSQLAGNFVKTVQSDYSASRHRTLTNAHADMEAMLAGMNIYGGVTLLNPALAFYTIAVERNFTKGRKKELVEAACLYIACRENKKAFLLIEFSDYLRINVYELGAVFLLLCKLLSLEEHPIVQKPVDPSLFIHRFAERLLGRRNNEVIRTALRIIASMKRDWMQTGRKPSGLCGAALYVSALSHGLKCSKSEVIRVVHICEATLTKRLIEFENTESGGLTIEEFNMKAEELEQEYRSAKQPNIGSRLSGTNELLCEHKGSGKASFAHGLCESCYDDFIILSGGLEGGSAPPAFQRAERERMTEESTKENASNSNFVTMPCNECNNRKDLNTPFEKESNIPNMSVNENLQNTEPKNTGTSTEHEAIGQDANDKLPGIDGTNATACDESESLSDIDDVEVDGYLHNEEEKHYKKIIWEEMNREYLEEQAAKEAAAAAAKKAFLANLHNCPEDVQAAQELAAAAAAAVAKSRKERQQKRAAEARNSVPAQTAAEATREMLTKKRLSSKINYDALEKLFDDSVAPENPKKSRTETHLKNDDDLRHIDKKQLESEDTYENGESGPEDEYDGVGDSGGTYEKHLYYENAEDVYDYDDNYGYDAY